MIPLSTAGFTRDVRKRLFGGMSWAILSAALSQGLGLLSWVIIARLMSQEDVGKYAIVLSTIAAAGSLVGVGLGVSTTRFVAENRDKSKDYAGVVAANSLAICGCVSVVFMVVIIAMKEPIASRVLHQPGLSNVLVISSPLIIMNSMNAILSAVLGGVEAFQVVTKNNAYVSVIRIVLTAGGAKAYGLSGAVLGLVAAQTISVVGLHRSTLKVLRREGICLSFKGSKAIMSQVLRFSVPVFMSNLVVGPTQWLANVILVRQADGIAQMALMAIAGQWQAAVRFVPQRAHDVSLPILSNLVGSRNEREVSVIFRCNFLIVSGVSLLVVLAVSLGSPWIVRMYGPSYASGQAVIVLMSISALLHSVSRSFTQLLFARGLSSIELSSAVLRCAILLGIWYALKGEGALGLATSICLSYCALILGLAFYSRSDLIGAFSRGSVRG